MSGDVTPAVSCGQPAAARIARDVLERGGNAVDAGVAATLALAVLQSEQVQFGGICPILFRDPTGGDVHSIEGVGRWPAEATSEYFKENHRGRLPRGVLRSVVPALPDACITALERFGTFGFADVALPAFELASKGFPAPEELAVASRAFERQYRKFPENASIWLPEGKTIGEGETFTNPGLARTLERLILIDQKARKSSGRDAGLRAVRDAFYAGELAAEIVQHIQAEGGWLSPDDLRSHKTPVVSAISGTAFGARVFSGAGWSQGACLTQCLQFIEEASDGVVKGSADYWHVVLEAIKLGFQDRDAYYGDPDFIDLDFEKLFSKNYVRIRVQDLAQGATVVEQAEIDPDDVTADTSVAVVRDADGRVFVSTPSDMSHDAPAVPGLGFVVSTRGGQSRVEDGHPTQLAPGKRPRVSACPFIVEKDDGSIIAGGGPGADLAIQAEVQILALHLGFGKDLQACIDAPRCFTMEPPGSSSPHLSFPDKVTAEEEFDQDVFDRLERRGHKIVRGTAEGLARPSVCLVQTLPGQAGAMAFGDPRRKSGQWVG